MSEATPSGGTTGLTHLFELARGGIGTVELAVRREGTFERVYAMKRLHLHLRTDESFCAMFVEEARIAGRLRHANIAGVLDVGTDEEGPYFVMEYVEGLTLRDLLKTASGSDLLPVQLVLRIIEQTARGLHAAHEATSETGEPLNLVHRDVSPHNILVGYDGVVRVADFGIAKVRDSENRTSTGILKGKMGYMSPEQLRFEPIERRSDIFSLGVTMFEALSAGRLYASKKGSSTEAAYRILHEDPPEIGAERRDVPPDLEALLLEMLAKNPEERPKDALEVGERIGAMLHELASEEEPIRISEFLAVRFAARKEFEADKVKAAIVKSRAAAEAIPATRPRRTWLLVSAGLLAAAGAIAFFAWPGGVDSLPIASPPELVPVTGPAAGTQAEQQAEEAMPAEAAPIVVRPEEEPEQEPTKAEVSGDSVSMMRRRPRPRRPREESSEPAPAAMERGDGWWPRM